MPTGGGGHRLGRAGGPAGSRDAPHLLRERLDMHPVRRAPSRQWSPVQDCNTRFTATLGSYSLGITHLGSDIDMLYLCPLHEKRGDYFPKFVAVLEKCDGATECSKIPDASNPDLNFGFR